VTAATGRAAEPPAGGPADEGRHRDRRLVLLACCLGLFVSTLDNTVANVALPSIGRGLKASTSQLQWVVDGYIVVRGSLLLTAGSAGDHYGRRRALQYGLAAFGVGSLLSSLAPNIQLLIFFRVLQALGGGFLVPSTLALIADAYPDRKERSKAIGIWSATTAVSTGLGPPVGGLLVDSFGWRSVFWINLPIVAIAIAMAARYAAESKESEPRPADIKGQVLVGVVLFAVTFGFIEASTSGWSQPLVVGALAVSGAGLLAFIILELRLRNPLLDPRLFRSREFSGAASVATLAFVVYAGFLFVNTLYLQGVRGFSPLEAGLIVTPTTAFNVVLSPLSGRLTAARGPRLPVTLAAIAMLAGSLLLAFSINSAPLGVLIVGYVLIGSGVGLVNTPITDSAVAGLPPERAGVAGAVTSTFRQVGNSLGVALLGTLTFSGFVSALPGEVNRLPVPAAEKATELATAHQAATSGGLGALQTGNATLSHAVAAAFGSGLHVAYLAAAASAALTLLAAVTLFRSSSPRDEHDTHPAAA
jgi:EmrB/QacA subfamily drug resistance transporter